MVISSSSEVFNQWAICCSLVIMLCKSSKFKIRKNYCREVNLRLRYPDLPCLLVAGRPNIQLCFLDTHQRRKSNIFSYLISVTLPCFVKRWPEFVTASNWYTYTPNGCGTPLYFPSQPSSTLVVSKTILPHLFQIRR